MAWVAVNPNGEERVSVYMPIRAEANFWYGVISLEMPKGSIQKLIGKELTWDDEPVELVEDGKRKAN